MTVEHLQLHLYHAQAKTILNFVLPSNPASCADHILGQQRRAIYVLY